MFFHIDGFVSEELIENGTGHEMLVGLESLHEVIEVSFSHFDIGLISVSGDHFLRDGRDVDSWPEFF